MAAPSLVTDHLQSHYRKLSTVKGAISHFSFQYESLPVMFIGRIDSTTPNAMLKDVRSTVKVKQL